jgi:hypothetical protein
MYVYVILKTTGMKNLRILKSLIDILYLVALLITIFLFIGVINLALYGGMLPGMSINGAKITNPSWLANVVLLIVLISGILFCYAVYLLRQTIGHFMKREFFIQKVVVNFRKVGIFTVLSSVISPAAVLLYNIVENGDLELTFGFGFDSLLVTLIVGLFFMVLAEVFKIAQNLKEENELTV